VESGNHSNSGCDERIKIIDRLIETIEKTNEPLPMVAAMINVTMYRGEIDKFKALIRTKNYAGLERRSAGY